MSKKMLSAAALAVFAGIVPAFGGIVDPEVGQYAGSMTIDYRTGQLTPGTRAGTAIYDNSATAATVATSSANMSTIWGDECLTTGTGTLDEFSFSVYNSSSSLTAMVSTGVSIGFNSMSGGVIGASMGGFTGTVTFSSPLAVGFYSIVTFTGLASLGINLSTTDVLVSQQLSATVGSTRAGIALSSPVTIGTSPVSFYKSDPSAPPAGFYVFSGGATPADTMYKIVIPAPGSLALLSFGGLVAGRRRR